MARSLWAAQGVVLRAAAALVVVLALSAASPAAAEVVATPLTLRESYAGLPCRFCMELTAAKMLSLLSAS
jgi:hypothetical protein